MFVVMHCFITTTSHTLDLRRVVTGQSLGKFAGRVWVYLLRVGSGSGPKK